MKKIYLLSIYCLVFLYSQGQVTAPPVQGISLQATVQLMAVELQAGYNLSPQTRVYAGGGYGVPVLATYNDGKYQYPMHRPGDIYLPLPMLAFFYHIGLQQQLCTPKVTEYGFFLYARGQFRHYFPTSLSIHNEQYSHQFRTALLAGLQHYMDKKHKWVLAFELGAALWSNYNLRHHAPGPQLNLHIARKLL